jgi:hypothetical protein
MAPELNQPLTEMSKGDRCVGLTTLPPSCADCLEVWEPVQTCNGIAYFNSASLALLDAEIIYPPSIIFQTLSQNFEKRTVGFVMSVRPSFCPHGSTRFLLDGFSWNLVFEYFFRKTVKKIYISLKSDRNKWHFTWRPIYSNSTLHEDRCTFLIISHSSLRRLRNVSEESCRDDQNTYIMFSNIFFRKSCRLWDNVGKRVFQFFLPVFLHN